MRAKSCRDIARPWTQSDGDALRGNGVSVADREDGRRSHYSRVVAQMAQCVLTRRADRTSMIRERHQRRFLVWDFHTIRPGAQVAPARSGLTLPRRQALVKAYGDELMIERKPDGGAADAVFMSHASLPESWRVRA